MEESAGREEKQELQSSDTQDKTSLPEMPVSLSQAHQVHSMRDTGNLSDLYYESDEAVTKSIQPAKQPDMMTLKGVLRFLLPAVATSLGESRLLTLLSLDWTNKELDLGLEFESLWKVELTSANIVLFLRECLVDTTPSIQVDPGEVEGLVVPAMRHVESRIRHQLAGKVRLHEIVKEVLESGRKLDWVSAHGGSIARVFASGPGDLLERCRSRKAGLQQDGSNRHTEEARDIQVQRVSVRPQHPMCSTLADWL